MTEDEAKQYICPMSQKPCVGANCMLWKKHTVSIYETEDIKSKLALQGECALR